MKSYYNNYKGYNKIFSSLDDDGFFDENAECEGNYPTADEYNRTRKPYYYYFKASCKCKRADRREYF